jgi:hypothetical protein
MHGHLHLLQAYAAPSRLFHTSLIFGAYLIWRESFELMAPALSDAGLVSAYHCLIEFLIVTIIDPSSLVLDHFAIQLCTQSQWCFPLHGQCHNISVHSTSIP